MLEVQGAQYRSASTFYLERALRVMPRHHPHASLQEDHRLADKVPELDPSQVDDDRDALCLLRLEHLHHRNIAKAAQTRNNRDECSGRTRVVEVACSRWNGLGRTVSDTRWVDCSGWVDPINSRWVD